MVRNRLHRLAAILMIALWALLAPVTAFAADQAPAGPPAVWKKCAAGCTPRFAATAVWDQPQYAVLVFAGEVQKGNAFGFFNDVWAYYPAKDQWKQLDVVGPSPKARAYQTAAWDSKRNVMWMFGGAGADFNGLGDLWSFDPATRKWTEMKPAAAPQGRLSPAIYYDAAADQLILFGGLEGFGSMTSPADLWTYSIKDNKWQQKRKDLAGRWQFASIFDPKTRRLMIQGGFDQKAVASSDLFIYEVPNDKWDKGNSPVHTDAAAAVWDAATSRMIIFGGGGAGKIGLDLVWYFDPTGLVCGKVATKGDDPVSGSYCATTLCGDGETMFLFGGLVNQFGSAQRDNNAWLLQLKPAPEGKKP